MSTEENNIENIETPEHSDNQTPPTSTWNNQVEDFNIDEDTDVDYAKPDFKTNKKINEKKKEHIAIDNLSRLSDIEIEKAVLFLLITTYSDTILETITNHWLKQELFISNIWKTLFNIIYDLWNTNKVDYRLVKDAYEKATKDDDEKNLLKQFFSFNGLIPKSNMYVHYIDLLTANFSRHWLNNLTMNLGRAIIDKDDDKIKYLKYEIENYELKADDDENPDVWLIDNEFLANQLTNWIEWDYKTQKTIIKTWYKMFDNKIGWFEKGTMTVFLARPSVWKSIALINTMYWMVQQWYNCLYVSAEMYAKYVYSRWASIDLEVNSSKIKAPNKLSNSEKRKVLWFNEKFKNEKNAHFYFDSIITWREIELVAKRIQSKHWTPLDAIFVDYLGKMYPNNLDMKRSRNDIVWDISRELFELWSSLDVAVITASQLNRANAWNNEQESLVVPKQSDIRDSGNVAQDADILIWITRDFIAWKECFTEDQSTDFNWHVIKNRNGEVWDFVFKFHPTIQKLKDKMTLFEEESHTPEWLARKTESIKNENIIKDILKEEEWDTFSMWNNDIFAKK